MCSDQIVKGVFCHVTIVSFVLACCVVFKLLYLDMFWFINVMHWCHSLVWSPYIIKHKHFLSTLSSRLKQPEVSLCTDKWSVDLLNPWCWINPGIWLWFLQMPESSFKCLLYLKKTNIMFIWQNYVVSRPLTS